jgi:hypothetical protein
MAKLTHKEKSACPESIARVTPEVHVAVNHVIIRHVIIRSLLPYTRSLVLVGLFCPILGLFYHRSLLPYTRSLLS